MKKSTSLSRRRALHLAAVAAAPLASLFAPVNAQATTTVYYSSNGTTQGGAGTWDSTTVNRFGTVAAGPYTLAWNNAASGGDDAVFGNTAGSITLSGPLTVHTVTTTITGFLIGNVNSSAAAQRIDFTSGGGVAANTGTTTITANFTGTLNKSGAGRLEMGNGANPTTVKYVITAGDITTASIARLSVSNPGSLVSDFLTFDGGGWAINTGNQDTGANRGITIKAGGAFFGSSSLTVATTVSSPIVGTAGGDVTVTGGGPFTGLSSSTAGNILILNNTANSWNGNAIINGPSGSFIRTAINNVVPDTAVVSVNAAGNTFDMATNNTTETVKSISGTAGAVNVGTGSLVLNNPAGETLTSVLIGASGGKVTKNGTGAITLAGSSTGFLGEFILNNGTVGVNGANIFGSTGTAQLSLAGGKLSNTSATARNLAVPQVNLNADFTVDNSLFASPGSIALQASTIKNSNRTITVGTASVLTMTGAIGQDVAGRSLTKNGVGTLELNNSANTYSGDTTINNGTLSVDADGTLGTGAGTINLAGGVLNASANRSVNAANPINMTASSSITTTSTATTVLMGFTSGSIAGSAGTLTIKNAGADGAGDTFTVQLSGAGINFTQPIALDNNAGVGKAVLQMFNAASTTQTFSGDITGNGSLRHSATVASVAGETVLSGNNTFNGTTDIFRGIFTLSSSVGKALGGTSGVSIGSNGIMRLAADDQVADAAPVSLDGGRIETQGFDEGSYTGLDVGIPSMGIASMTGSSAIDLDSGSSTVAFADSSSAIWVGTLSIFNWSGTVNTGAGTDRVYFGDGSGLGLTPLQLAQIQFYSGPTIGSLIIGTTTMLSTGEVVPLVPEPASLSLLGLAVGGLLARRRRSR